jgi:hypothetical protein
VVRFTSTLFIITPSPLPLPPLKKKKTNKQTKNVNNVGYTIIEAKVLVKVIHYVGIAMPCGNDISW